MPMLPLALLPDAGGPIFGLVYIALIALAILVPLLIIAGIVILIVVLNRHKKAHRDQDAQG